MMIINLERDYPGQWRKRFSSLTSRECKAWDRVSKIEKPAFAVGDLRLNDGNGLEVVKEIQINNPNSRIIMLTGYGNIPTAVAAIKEGAIDYLAKPADADDVEKALLADPKSKASPPENPMSTDRVKWEHIHKCLSYATGMFRNCQRLKMHRRTLQRILSKISR